MKESTGPITAQKTTTWSKAPDIGSPLSEDFSEEEYSSDGGDEGEFDDYPEDYPEDDHQTGFVETPSPILAKPKGRTISLKSPILNIELSRANLIDFCSGRPLCSKIEHSYLHHQVKRYCYNITYRFRESIQLTQYYWKLLYIIQSMVKSRNAFFRKFIFRVISLIDIAQVTELPWGSNNRRIKEIALLCPGFWKFFRT